jgi:hypothetical protein
MQLHLLVSDPLAVLAQQTVRIFVVLRCFAEGTDQVSCASDVLTHPDAIQIALKGLDLFHVFVFFN